MMTKPHVFEAALTAESNLNGFFKESMVVVRTEFFRDKDMQRDLEEIVLPDLFSTSAKRTQKLKIWSAGCSEGREPYSIAAIVHRWMEQTKYHRVFNYSASDINNDMITIAKSGHYQYQEKDNRRLVGWDKYFSIINNEIVVDAILKKIIRFQCEDILQSKVNELQDIIVCANVLLYYEPEFRKIIVSELSKKLKSGGYIYLESIGRRYMSSIGLKRFGYKSRFFKKN